jgi:hypothetical protein
MYIFNTIIYYKLPYIKELIHQEKQLDILIKKREYKDYLLKNIK